MTARLLKLIGGALVGLALLVPVARASNLEIADGSLSGSF